MKDTYKLSEFSGFGRILPIGVIAAALADSPEERQATKDLGLLSIRKLQEFFAALRMTERRAFRRSGSGCAMLGAKLCLGVLVAALAGVSTGWAQTPCNPSQVTLTVDTVSGQITSVSAQSVTCALTPGSFNLPGVGTFTSIPASVTLDLSCSNGNSCGASVSYLWNSGLGVLLSGAGLFSCGGYYDSFGECTLSSGQGYWWWYSPFLSVEFLSPGDYPFTLAGGSSTGQISSALTLTVHVVGGEDGSNLGPCGGRATCMADAPINLTDGNVWVQETDYSVPGLGGGLQLSRVWNSRLIYAGPPTQTGMFGSGWRSAYEEQLFLAGTQTLRYWRGDGSSWTFTYNSVLGTYSLSSPPDVRAQLVQNPATGVVTITFADGTQRVFNSQNLLAAIIDRNGNQTTVAYDSSNRITSVTSPGGSTLTFSYNDPVNVNQATSAQDGVGTVATYTYDSSSRLTMVTYPDGSSLNFTYDVNSNILSVTDSQGKLLESHTYDSQGRGLTSSRAYGVDSVSLTY